MFLAVLLNGCAVYIVKVEPQRCDTVYVFKEYRPLYKEYEPSQRYYLGDTLPNFIPDVIWKDCK